MRIVLFAALVAIAAAKVRYDGYKVFRLYPNTEDQIQMIRTMHEDIELDFWTDTDVMVSPSRLSDVTAMLNMPFETLHENVQDLLDREEEELSLKVEGKRNLNEYQTYAEIVQYVDDFVAACPSGSVCTRESLGSSVEGRDVPAVRLVTNAGNDYVYLDSLIHCREWIAGATVLNIMDRLISGTDAEAIALRQNYNWFLAPVINPDGYVYTWTSERMWRKNRGPNSGSACIGTDLNRNFDAYWGYSGTSTNPCADTYGGPSAASAIETRNVQNQLSSLSMTAMISYHSYANMWLHAYGATTTPGGSTCARSGSHDSINAVSQAAANAVQSTGGQNWVYGPVCTVIYPASGSTVDYCHDSASTVQAFTPELRGSSFNPPASQIQPSYLEQWAGLVAMLDAIGNLQK